MKYLKHINEMNLDGPNIRGVEELCKSFLQPPLLSERFGYQIQPDGKVFVPSRMEVSIQNPSITELPFQFSDRVDGSIYISGAKNLTTLQGLPKEYVANLSISRSPKITSLEGCPESVHLFSISNTSITNLLGGPRECEFYGCRENKLTSLEGAPEEVDRFTCADNPLTNLLGAPRRIGKLLDVGKCNRLTSLEGIPIMFEVKLDLAHCTKLFDPTPLRGSIFKGNYHNLHRCPINSLLRLFKNSEQSGDEDFKDLIDSLDYNYIRILPDIDGDKVCLNYFRLCEALREFDIPISRLETVCGDSKFPYTIIDDEGNPINIDPY